MVNNIQNALISQFGESNYLFQNNNHVLTLDMDSLSKNAGFIKSDLDFILLLDICAIDNLKRDTESPKRFELVYHFLNMAVNQRLRIKFYVDEEQWIPSIQKLWSNAKWYEREIVDLMGLRFSDSSYTNLLLPVISNEAPLRKDFNNKSIADDDFLPLYMESLEKEYDPTDKIEQWIENNSMISGNARFRFWMNGDEIRKAKVDIGYHHRGLEKKFEGCFFEQGNLLTNYLNFYSSGMNNFGWCKAIEEHLNIEITDRAKCLRMIFTELSRIADHLNCLGTMATTIDILPYEKYLIEQREKIYALFEKVTGARFDLGFSRIGGMAYDLPSGWISECMETIKTIQSSIERYSKLLIQSTAWMNRVRVGETSAYQAIEAGFTGPNLRASGVNYDIRKSSPYYFYDQVDFDVIVGTTGDCYDRFLVRIEEIKQSLRIVSQVLDNIPPGEIRIFKSELAGHDKSSLEAFCNEMKKPIKSKNGEIYSSTEVSNGELGFYIATEEANKPYRVKIRVPGFSLLQSYEELVQGRSINEARAILASLNIVMSEIDR